MRRLDLLLGILCLFVAIAGIGAAQLDFEGWIALLSLLAFLMAGFAVIPLDQYLDSRRGPQRTPANETLSTEEES